MECRVCGKTDVQSPGVCAPCASEAPLACTLALEEGRARPPLLMLTGLLATAVIVGGVLGTRQTAAPVRPAEVSVDGVRVAAVALPVPPASLAAPDQTAPLLKLPAPIPTVPPASLAAPVVAVPTAAPGAPAERAAPGSWGAPVATGAAPYLAAPVDSAPGAMSVQQRPRRGALAPLASLAPADPEVAAASVTPEHPAAASEAGGKSLDELLK